MNILDVGNSYIALCLDLYLEVLPRLLKKESLAVVSLLKVIGFHRIFCPRQLFSEF